MSERVTPNTPPFTSFNFAVEIVDEVTRDRLTSAAFAECDGLEVTVETKTVREGGRQGPVHLTGQLAYGQLTLKRGMTTGFELWRWFERVASGAERGLRAEVMVVMLASGPAEAESNSASRGPPERPEQARFLLTGCVPVKLKGPALNAKDGLVAVEEIQLAFEHLALQPPTGGVA